jgi:hypothetical protein
MTSIPGVDYAWSHPGGAALKAAGKAFACRYLSPDSSKNLTRAEAADLAAHGIWAVVVWEGAAARAKAGKAAGAADAKTASVQATATGMPSSRPIYFAVDFDATEADQTYINAYLDGAASVIGRDRVGIYGGYYSVKRALDGGHAKWAWQTIAWSGGQWDSRAVIRQGAQKSINGVSCDLNTAVATDYGQWMPGKTPTVEEDVALTKADLSTLFKTDDVISAPDAAGTPAGNTSWTLESYLRYGFLQDRETNAVVKQLAAKVDVQGQTITKLVQTVATLASNVGHIDPAAIVAELTQAIESITVHLDVPPAPGTP